MSVESAIYSRLTGHAGLSALISTRVYPQLIPQNPTLPAIAYTMIGGVPVNALANDTTLMDVNFQFDIIAESQSEVLSVEAQLRSCLQRWKGTAGGTEICDAFLTNQVDLYDDDTNYFRRALTFDITYRTA